MIAAAPSAPRQLFPGGAGGQAGWVAHRLAPSSSPCAPHCCRVPLQLSCGRAEERRGPAVPRQHVGKAKQRSTVTSCPCAPSCPSLSSPPLLHSRTVPGIALLPCIPTASHSSLQGWGARSGVWPPCLSAPLQQLSGPGEAGVHQQIPVLLPRVARDVAGHTLHWRVWSSSLRVWAASRGRAGCIPALAARQDTRVPGVRPARPPAAGPSGHAGKAPHAGRSCPGREAGEGHGGPASVQGVGEPRMS